MITITSSIITRAYPLTPKLTFWQQVWKRFGRLDKEKPMLFHYDFLLQVESVVGLAKHDILMLRHGVRLIITRIDGRIVKAITYQEVERMKSGDLNGQGIVLVHGQHTEERYARIARSVG